MGRAGWDVWAWIVVGSGLAACGGAEEPAPVEPLDPTLLAPPPEGQGFQLSLEATVEPFSEAWICDVARMPNFEYANVNRAEVKQTEGMHHLTLSTLGLTPGGTIPYGRYDCEELYGDSSLMEDQIMFFGNQGVGQDDLKLPTGVAAQFPVGLDVVFEVHFVNTSPEPVDLFSRVNAWTIPSNEVIDGIWGGSIRDENIALPPQSEHTEWSRCVFNEDVEVVFLASHMHQLGTNFEIRQFDGETTSDVMYTNDDWHVPRITQYDPPLVVPAGQGFEWSCTWNNTTDEAVGYGNAADDEMCNLAVVHTPFSTSARCEVVETSDGVLWEPSE